MYSEETIGEKLKLWASKLCTACIVLGIVGALISLIVFGVFLEEAFVIALVALCCLPVFVVTAIFSPFLFAKMYAKGVIVTELQEMNKALKKSNDPEPPARSE